MVGLKNRDPLPPPGDCLRNGENTGTLQSPDGKNLVGVGSAARPIPPRDGGGRCSIQAHQSRATSSACFIGSVGWVSVSWGLDLAVVSWRWVPAVCEGRAAEQGC